MLFGSVRDYLLKLQVAKLYFEANHKKSFIILHFVCCGRPIKICVLRDGVLCVYVCADVFVDTRSYNGNSTKFLLRNIFNEYDNCLNGL